MSLSVITKKSALRDQLLVCRQNLPAQNPEAGLDLITHSAPLFAKIRVVAGYWPINTELDPRPLLHALAQQNFPICLPVVEETHGNLIFREWSPCMPLQQGPFGTKEPPSHAPILHPGLLLVPLLGFDGKGYRLGYGQGHYDRTLKKLRQERSIIAVGVAFDEQYVDNIPYERHDEGLDFILTPSGLMTFHHG